MTFPMEFWLAFGAGIIVADCPHCGEHPCRCVELEMRAEAEANIDKPGCCSVLQPCGDGCNCPPEWKE